MNRKVRLSALLGSEWTRNLLVAGLLEMLVAILVAHSSAAAGIGVFSVGLVSYAVGFIFWVKDAVQTWKEAK